MAAGPHLGFTQPPPLTFERLTVAGGLSQSLVYTITQDPQGFMWFGTGDGLNRYDGYAYQIYQSDPFDPNTLSSHAISSLTYDAEGQLWAGTTIGGLNRLDPATGHIARFTHDPQDLHSLSHNLIAKVLLDRAGRLWIGTVGGGLNRFEPATERFKRYPFTSGSDAHTLGGMVRALAEDTQGRLWIGTDAGLSRLDPTTEQITRFGAADTAGGIHTPADISALHVDTAGTLWIGTWGEGLYRWTAGAPALERFPPPSNAPPALARARIRCLRSTADGMLWIGTWNDGLYQLDPRTGRLEQYQHQPGDPNSLSSNRIYDLFEDQVGRLWIGTTRGVSMVHARSARFTLRRHAPGNPGSLSASDVVAVYEGADGTLWAGTTTGGLNAVTPSTGQVTHYRFQPDAPTSLSNDYVLSILEDRQGTLWVGTWGGGLNRFTPSTGRFTRLPPASNKTADRDVFALHEDAEGALWVGTDGAGLHRLDPATGEVTVYQNQPENPHSLSSDRVRYITATPDGTLWIGTSGGGLNRFDPQRQFFQRFMHDPEDPTTLSSNAVYVLHYSPTDTALWIGTAGGLNRLNPTAASPHVAHITTRQGLPSNVIKCILEDDAGYLWLSTNQGLSRFNRADGEVRTFGTGDRLQNREFNFGACHRGPSGLLHFGGIDGLASFQPGTLDPNSAVPPVRITGFRVFNEPTPTARPLWEPQTIRLTHRQNFFTFEFAALDYTAPAQNQYRYQLEGLDADWVEAGTQRRATYTSVPPGTYRFRVQGSNNDGVWNRDGAALHLVVAPPFWQTWWFRLLAFGLLAGLLYAGYRYRMNRLLEMERLRLRIAGDLHDDIGANLGSIALMSDMVRRRGALTDRDRTQLEKLSQAARQTASNLREIVWFVDPDRDKLDDLVARMRQIADDLLGDLPHTFTVSGDGLSSRLDMHFRRDVLLIYKELLHNAMRHAQATQIDIHITQSEKAFSLRVSDDGVGFSLPGNGQGNGLKNMQHRAAHAGGTLRLESRPGAGTVAHFSAHIT